MLRFIVKMDYSDNVSGAAASSLVTTTDANELEDLLRGGGRGESGFDVRTLIGVEVLDEPTEDEQDD